MAVYKRGYERYQGPRTGRGARLLVLPRFAWARLMDQRLIVVVFIVSMFWPVACAAFVYLSNRTELLAGFGGPLLQYLTIDGSFFVTFMNTQAVFAILLAAIAGPSLIAPDLANGALPLYFSRPLGRWEYALARMLVLVGILSPVTWVPGMLLFAMQSSMAGWSWFASNLQLGLGVVVGFALWIVFVGLVAMASSAYVKWKVVAGALVIAFFFVLAGASALTQRILRVDWPLALNPSQSMNQVWRGLLGAELNDGPGVVACLVVLSGMAGVLLWIVERRIRPVEVVK